MEDIQARADTVIQIDTAQRGRMIWVNVDGECVTRIYNPKRSPIHIRYENRIIVITQDGVQTLSTEQQL